LALAHLKLVVQKWHDYCVTKREKNARIQSARQQYIWKLGVRCMSALKQYKTEHKAKRTLQSYVESSLKQKRVDACFQVLVSYSLYRRQKRETDR
jgi:hypothetical protein